MHGLGPPPPTAPPELPGASTLLEGLYLPGRYLTEIKRPGERYILRGILQEDFAFWVLGSIAYALTPLLHLAGLALLLLSFWAIYERGYVDNDRIAARCETDPKLSLAFHDRRVPTPAWQPWIWAGIAGTGGILLLHPGRPQLADFLRWGAVLVVTYGWFLVYNRYDKGTRVWLYAGLQYARSAAFVCLVPVGVIGAVGLGAHVLARWVPYYLYRDGSRTWPEAPMELPRLLFFIVGLSLLAAAQGRAVMATPTALAFLGWNLYRARQPLALALTTAHRIDRREN